MAANTEVTSADIARMAGVGRAAVSNWRRRHPDFPQPIGGPANSPTFALDAVERWLTDNGRLTAADGMLRPDPRSRGRSPLAGALASVVPAVTGGIVLDPGCVDGSCLAAVAALGGGRPTYVGQCMDEADAATSRGLLAEAGARATDIVVGEPFDDTLAAYLGRADVVVSNPPPMPLFAAEDAFDRRWEFGPPNRGDAALAWVQVAYSYLKPGGHAALTVPFGAATRASSRRTRAELLRAGVLTHVIALPERSGTAAGPWQIWVLRRPTGRPTHTLRMVDLTGHGPQDIPQTRPAWEAIFLDGALTREVPSIELLDEDVFLVPSAHVVAEVREVAPEYRELAASYRRALRALPDAAPRFGQSRPADLPMVTVADLVRAGALEIRERRADVNAGDVVIPHGGGRLDGITVATGPGDEQRSVTVVRCDPDQIDPYFLACFLRSEANRRQAVGTLGGTFRLDVRRARVPRIPLTEQRRYGDAFRGLTEFAARATEAATAAEEVVRTAVYGLTSGVLAPATARDDVKES